MPKCPKCEQFVPEHVNFCSNCGSSLDGKGKKGIVVECARCDGTGQMQTALGPWVTCKVCKGKGKVRV